MAAHSHEAFDKDQQKESAGDFLGNLVYGALDGVVTTFAVVAGAAGAGLSPGIVLVLGFANIFADGLSMAAGTFLSIKSTQSYYDAERKREEWEVDNYPKGEREEIKRIYSAKGFAGKNLEKIVEIITSKKSVWVDTMMLEELGMTPQQVNPVKAAVYTYAAFVGAGTVPLLAFLYSFFRPIESGILFPAAVILTFITIFATGAMRSLVISKNWFEAGMEMLIVGGITAIVSYGLGTVLGGLVL